MRARTHTRTHTHTPSYRELQLFAQDRAVSSGGYILLTQYVHTQHTHTESPKARAHTHTHVRAHTHTHTESPKASTHTHTRARAPKGGPVLAAEPGPAAVALAPPLCFHPQGQFLSFGPLAL